MGTKIMQTFLKLAGFGSCIEVQEVSYEYSEGIVIGRRQRRIKRHLKICPHCMRFTVSYRAVRFLGRTMHPERMSEEQKQKILEGLNLNQ